MIAGFFVFQASSLPLDQAESEIISSKPTVSNQKTPLLLRDLLHWNALCLFSGGVIVMRFGSVCLTLFMMGLLSEQVAGDDLAGRVDRGQVVDPVPAPQELGVAQQRRLHAVVEFQSQGIEPRTQRRRRHPRSVALRPFRYPRCCKPR